MEEKYKTKKNLFNYLDKNKKNDRIKKIIEQIKNGDNQVINENFPLISEVIEEKKKAFTGIVKKTHNQFLRMSQEELQIYANNFTEKILMIEKFINNYIENIDSFHIFDPVQENINEIKEKLKTINNKINEISYKYKNNNIVFENGDKVIQRLKNENYLLRKQIYEYDKKNIYSTISTNSLNHKLTKRTFSNKDNMKLNLNNYNNYNTILTTASSNNQTGQLYGPSSTRGLIDQNLYSNTNDKYTIDVNDDYHRKRDFILKRPISSKKINPYFFVAENLK